MNPDTITLPGRTTFAPDVQWWLDLAVRIDLGNVDWSAIADGGSWA